MALLVGFAVGVSIPVRMKAPNCPECSDANVHIGYSAGLCVPGWLLYGVAAMVRTCAHWFLICSKQLH